MDNYEQPLKRLQSTERKLAKETVVKEIYESTIESYIETDYINKTEDSKSNEEHWFLPHYPVVRMSKESTKV